MKKHFFFLLLFSCLTIQAQDIQQALMASQTSLAGGARYTAMGGAFGAIGGDLNAININPAGSSIFSFSEAGFSGFSFSQNNETNYFGTNSKEKNREIGIHQAGIVLVLNNENSPAWSKVAVGFNYQKTANFNDRYVAQGNNPSRGMDAYFLAFAQGYELRDIMWYDDETFGEAYRAVGNTTGLGYSGQQALFGYAGYMINGIPFEGSNDMTDPSIRSYTSNVLPGANGFNHRYESSMSGSQKRYTFNVSGVYQDKLYVGLNINSYSMEFSKITTLQERGYAQNSNVQFLDFYNELFSIGTGTSLQLGFIYKLDNAFRLGLTLDSPTYYRFSDRIYQNLYTEVYNTNDQIDPVDLDPRIGGQVVETYIPEYEFDTPGGGRASIAYIFKDRGLLSIDYSQRKFQNAQFAPQRDAYLNDLNQQIAGNYSTRQLLQIGGEYRVNPQISLRAGYAHEKANQQGTDNSRGLFSGGIGYNFGASNVDVSIASVETNGAHRLFETGLTDSYRLEQNRFQLVISYRLKL